MVQPLSPPDPPQEASFGGEAPGTGTDDDCCDYDAFADTYDIAYADFTADLPFWVALASGKKTVLDVGCGSGRITERLATVAGRVTAVDLSQSMLAVAEKKLAGRVELLSGDLRKLPVGDGQFDCVLCTRGVFSHLIDAEDQLAAGRELARVASADGVVAVDVPRHPLGDLYASSSVPTHLLRSVEHDGAMYQFYAETELNTVRNYFDLKQTVVRPGPAPVEQQIRLRTRICTPNEITLALAAAGLEVFAMYGDYDATPVSEGSPRIIVLAVHQMASAPKIRWHGRGR